MYASRILYRMFCTVCMYAIRILYKCAFVCVVGVCMRSGFCTKCAVCVCVFVGVHVCD